jgi:hypothetical protein
MPPVNVDQGGDDNQGVIVIPPSKYATTTATSLLENEDAKRDAMTWAHDHLMAGHPRQDETIWRTKSRYFWPGMNAWITDYVKGCTTCQQNKILTHRHKTLLYHITVPINAKPFQQIAMDLIMGLPQSGKHNAILTIVDHGCSHGAIFLPCSTMITREGVVQLYFCHVFPWFGLSTKIISD